MAQALLTNDDEIALIRTIERSFGIAFPKAELTRFRTIGDLYQGLLELVPHHDGPSQFCLTARAYRRLLNGIRKSPKPKRDSLIDDAVGRIWIRYRWRELSYRSGLRLPTLPIRLWPTITATLVSGAAVAGGSSSFWMAALAAGATFIGLCAVFGARPRGCTTLGDLARVTAALNVKTLAGNQLLPKRAVWSAYSTILMHECALDAAPDIHTRFFPE